MNAEDDSEQNVEKFTLAKYPVTVTVNEKFCGVSISRYPKGIDVEILCRLGLSE